MKKRTKEENAAYSKMLRDKKRSTPVAPSDLRVAPTVAPVKNVAPVAPCSGCLIKDLEIKRLRADLALAKLELEKRVHTAVVSDATLPYNQSPLRTLKPLGNSYKPNSLYGA
jgi:hypothetical protein